MTKINFLSLMLVAVMFVGFSSCSKDDATEQTEDNSDIYVSRSHNGEFDSEYGSAGELSAVMNYTDGDLTITSVSVKYDISDFFGEMIRTAVIKWEGEGSIYSFSWVGQLLDGDGEAILLDGEPVYCSYAVGTINDAGEDYGWDVSGSPSWDAAFVYFNADDLTVSTDISADDAKTIYKADFVLGNLTLLEVNDNKVQ